MASTGWLKEIPGKNGTMCRRDVSGTNLPQALAPGTVADQLDIGQHCLGIRRAGRILMGIHQIIVQIGRRRRHIIHRHTGTTRSNMLHRPGCGGKHSDAPRLLRGHSLRRQLHQRAGLRNARDSNGLLG